MENKEDLGIMFDGIEARAKNDKLKFAKKIQPGKKYQMTYEGLLTTAFYAIKDKTTIYDGKRKKIFAFRDNIVLEIEPQMEEQLAVQLRETLKNWLKRVKGKIYSVQEVAEIFLNIERYDASYISHKALDETKDLFYDFIRSEREKGPAKEVTIGMALHQFLGASRADIPQGVRSFKNVEYTVRFDREKEMLRALYLAELIRKDVLDFDFLKEFGEFERLSPDFVDYSFRGTRALERDQLIEAMMGSGELKNEEEVLEYYFKVDRKFFYEIATTEQLVNYWLADRFDDNGKRNSERNNVIRKFMVNDLAEIDSEVLERLLSVENLPKNNFIDSTKDGNYISKFLLKKLGRESLLRILCSDTVKYKNSLTSEELIDRYEDLVVLDYITLFKRGYINPEDMIKLVKFANVDKGDIKPGLSLFYNAEILERVIKEGKATPKFLEDYDKFVNEMLSKEEREEYQNRLAVEISQREDKEEYILDFVRNGIEFGKIENYQIGYQRIEDLYIEEAISEKDILKLYSKGLTTLDVIDQIFSQEEILENYKSGKLDARALSLIKDKKVLAKEFEEERIPAQDVITIYAMENGIGLEDLKTIMGDKIDEIEIGELLPDTISQEKIEELFKNYYISHDELSILVSRGLVTKEQADKYAQELTSHEEFESMFQGSGIAVLTRDTEGESTGPRPLSTPSGTVEHKLKNDPDLQIRLLEELGFDKRTIKLVGATNSLNGYTVYPSEDLGVMVFIKNEKVGNATYIMSLAQGMYFLKKVSRGKGEASLESDATKNEIRETEHVRVRNASKGWGQNIVDSIRQLNPEFAQKYRRDSEYQRRVKAIIEDIREDYDLRRG